MELNLAFNRHKFASYIRSQSIDYSKNCVVPPGDEMEVVDVNGGNAEAANENSNLENVANTLNILQDSEESIIDDFKMEPPDTTDDIKLSPPKTSSPASSPAAKRKLRKFKANSTSSNETDLSPKLLKGRKRKFSELDDLSSEESIEFTGFDHHESDEVQTFRNHVLQKLIGNIHYYFSMPLI